MTPVELLEKELAAQGGELAPPWARLPWIHRYSIGWRMGVGESYAMVWHDFLARFASTAELIAYLRRHPPAPRTWRDWVGSALAAAAGEGDEEDEDGAVPARWQELAEREQLVGDDVAFPTFVRNELARGGVRAPWCSSDSPAAALRYSTRELGFWARYVAGERVAWQAYVATQPAPTDAWQEAVAAIGAGAPACYRTLDGGAVALLPEWVQLGELPPPWRDGHDAIADVEWDEAADDRHRWMWWVIDTFEDRASWAAYLARWPAPPPAWRGFLDEQLADLT